MRMRWLAIVLLITSGACGEDDPVLWQGHAAETARELNLLDAPEVRYFTRQEWSDRAAASADTLSEETLQYYADTYGRMGYFDMMLDLRPVFAGSSSDWVGASYSPGANVISLIGDARDDTIAHEYVHALQDDHFDIVTFDLKTSDGFLARRSVVEGDAVVAQLRFLAHRDGADLQNVDWEPLFQSRRDYSATTLSDAAYPVVFLDYVSLVYTYGFEYMTANLTGATYDSPQPVQEAPYDWTRANEMYGERMVEYTEQILKRDLLKVEHDDPVVDVGLRAVPEALTDRLLTVDWDSLGRWYSYLLLYPLEKDGQLDATAISAAWDGDNALFVRDLMTDASGVVWASEWDDDTAAQNMVDALWLLHGYTAVKGEPEYIGMTDAGEIAWIERRGNRVVMAINIASDVAGDLVTAAFTGTNTMVKRRYRSLPETIDRAYRSAGIDRCAVVSHWLRQPLKGFADPKKK